MEGSHFENILHCAAQHTFPDKSSGLLRTILFILRQGLSTVPFSNVQIGYAGDKRAGIRHHPRQFLGALDWRRLCLLLEPRPASETVHFFPRSTGGRQETHALSPDQLPHANREEN